MSDCIEWRNYRNKDGYGIKRFRGKNWKAHRVAWVQANGEIPVGVNVLHHCDNPPCVNPEHLFLGTQQDNMQDMLDKGRGGQKGRPKVSLEQAEEIRRRYLVGGVRQRELASEYGLSQPQISVITRGARLGQQ